MNVSELYDLGNWAEQQIIKNGLIERYQNLYVILNQNAQPNQQQSPFESQKNDLIQSIKNVELLSLTKEQKSFLLKVKVLPAIGEAGVQQLEDILFRNAIDVATAAQNIHSIFIGLSEGIRTIKTITEELQKYIEKNKHTDEKETIIRISFFGRASISNVKEFKDWGTKWHDIGRGFSMAHNSTPEDVRITGAAKGSVILELVSTYAIVKTLSAVILEILKVFEKVQDIRKKAAEIKNMNLQNVQIAKDLEESAEQEKESCISKIIEEQKSILQLENKEGKDGERITALEKAVKTLVGFIDLGGEIDFMVPEEENSENTSEKAFAKIREQAQEIRALEDRLKVIVNNIEEN